MLQKAVALKYKQQENAPKIVASGKDVMAKKIIQQAQKFDVPIFANEVLVNSLMEIEVDTEIPPQLYQSVVEVFIWLVNNDKKLQH